MDQQLRQECLNVIEEYAGVRVPEEFFDKMVEYDPEVFADIVKYRSPSDTMDRENMLCVLGKMVMGTDWPCYGDGEEHNRRWMIEFRLRCVDRGWIK